MDEILTIVEGDQGPDRNEELIQGLKAFRSRPEAERSAVDQSFRKPNVGITLKQYSIPLFVTQLADLAICTREFQRAVLHIRQHLDLYNQLVPYTQWLAEKTFNNPTPSDRAALIANQEEAYRDACTRAEIIMRSIGDLRKLYGTPT